MNKSLIIALFCFVTQRLHAQQAETDSTIALNSTSVVETPAIPIASIKIVTALPDTTTIGYAGRPAKNGTFRLIPETALTHWLQTYVNSKYKKIYYNNGRQVAWIVQNLSISQDTTENNVFIRLKANIAVSVNNTNFTVISAVDTVIINKGSDAKYSIVVQKALQLLFDLSTNIVSSAATVGLTLNDLIINNANQGLES